MKIRRKVLVGFLFLGGLLGCNENDEEPSQSLHVQINDVNPAAPNGNYAYAERADKGAWAEFTNSYSGPGGGWLSAHTDCHKGVRVSPGGVTVTLISIVNGAEYIQAFKRHFLYA